MDNLRADNQLIMALYGNACDESTRNQNLLDFYSWVDSFSKNLAIKLTNFSCAHNNDKTKLKWGKCYTLERKLGILRTALENDSISQLNLSSLLDSANKCVPAFDWDLTATFDLEESTQVLLSLGIQEDYLETKSRGFVEDILSEMIEFSKNRFDVCYGFAVTMPRSFMPSGYASGLACTSTEMFIYDSNLWRQQLRKKADSVLRNNFGINVVNEMHLKRMVSNKTLSDWIHESNERGTIKKSVREDVSLWVIPQNEMNISSLRWDVPSIANVRDALMKHNFFAWQDFL